MQEIDQGILDRIDELKLDGRLSEWRSAMKASDYALYPERMKFFIESWKESEGDDLEIRRAKAFKYLCQKMPISILPWEYIVGKSTPGIVGAIPAMDIAGDYIDAIWDDDEVEVGYSRSVKLDDETKAYLREAATMFRNDNIVKRTEDAVSLVYGDWVDEAVRTYVKDPGFDGTFYGASTGSCDFQYIINNGLRAYIARAEAHIDEEIKKHRPDVEKIYFWKASIMCMEGIIEYAHRYADLAREMAADCSDPVRKKQLEEIAETCMKVPENPATSFHEALQAMALVGVGKIFEHPTHNYPQWGRGDQYLYPFFKKDVTSGAISVKEASEMLGELIGRWGTSLWVMPESVKDSHQVNYGINSLILGGYNQQKVDASNELTALFLKTISLLKLSSPTVTLRCNPTTPEWIMDRAIECNLETRGGIPLFQNDDRTIKQFLDYGIPWSEAVEWISIGCVYPTLLTRAEHTGMEGVAAMNLAALLDMALHNGRDINGYLLGVDCGDAKDFTSIDEIMDAMFAQHKKVIDNTVGAAHIALDVEPRYFREPFWSTIAVPWYFEHGQDLLKADPEWSLFGIGDRAIIDCADTLAAIDYLVFDPATAKLTMAELMDALDSDFAGERGEEIRQMCLAAPKFGNDIDKVDMLVSEISDRSAGYIKNMDNSPYKNLMITREGLSWHYAAGLGVRALADGRKCREPLDDGSFSPMGGADKNGPTAVLRSVLKAQQKDAAASVLNQKFTAALLSNPNAVSMLGRYTEAFLRAGGSHIQYNIVDTEELKEAQSTPEKYEDLLVRIGGFSAYFVQLSEGIQNDVIARSELAL